MTRLKNYILLLFLCITILFAGCDTGLEIVGMEISEFPGKIVYYAGRDTQLNLSGGKVKLTVKSGREYIYEMTEDEFEIIHSIDFNTEGVYVVEVRRTAELYSRFPIQVLKIGNGPE